MIFMDNLRQIVKQSIFKQFKIIVCQQKSYQCYLFAIMMPFQDDEKGLFTFYKQQADLEEQLQRPNNLGKKSAQQQQHHKLRIINFSTSLNQSLMPSPTKIKSQQSPKQKSRQKIEKNNQEQEVNYEFSHRLKLLLQKHKDITKINKHASVALKPQNKHLDFSSVKGSHSTAMDRQKQYNNVSQNLSTKRDKLKEYCIFVDKKIHLNKGNPLQKKVLSPTSFDVQLEEHNSENSKQGKQALKNVVASRYHQLKYGQSRSNSREKEYMKVQMQNQIKRQILPKISKSQTFKKYDKINGLKQQYLFNKRKNNTNFFEDQSQIEINSDNLKHTKNASLMFSQKRGNLSYLPPMQRKATQNSIYPLFIENRQLVKAQSIEESDREKILLMIVKKMKFT